MFSNKIAPLTTLPRDVADHTNGSQKPTYRQVYYLALNGAIPVEQSNGRWYYQREDLPKIAEVLARTVRRRVAVAA